MGPFETWLFDLEQPEACFDATCVLAHLLKYRAVCGRKCIFLHGSTAAVVNQAMP